MKDLRESLGFISTIGDELAVVSPVEDVEKNINNVGVVK